MTKWLALLALLISAAAIADGTAIDKVYHPYVQPLERELEWRMVAAEGDYLQRLGLGKSFSDNVFIEIYLIGQNEDDNFSLEAYELESLIQLTEQGEYAIDWGILFELEKVHEQDAWEFATAVLMEKEFGRWVGAANIKLIYEGGSDIDSELESALAMQFRYRLSRELEPAIEIYSGENTRAIGPVAMGDFRFTGHQKLHWESGVLLGLDKDTPGATLRFLVEYEF
jgi:hypothetical protein